MKNNAEIALDNKRKHFLSLVREGKADVFVTTKNGYRKVYLVETNTNAIFEDVRIGWWEEIIELGEKLGRIAYATEARYEDMGT